MKKYIYIPIVCIVVALLVSGVLYWISTRDDEIPPGATVRAFIDVTDKDSGRVTGASILSLALEGQSILDPVTVQIEPISSYHNNVRKVVHLKGISWLMGNEPRRKRQLAELGKQIDTVLNQLYAIQEDRQGSIIFEHIVRSANELAKERVTNKVIIVQSDLLENTTRWSSYRTGDLAEIEDNPQAVERKLLQGEQPGDWKQITVYLIHVPRSKEDDERYTTMARFYKRVFERYGATVSIGSNLLTLK